MKHCKKKLKDAKTLYAGNADDWQWVSYKNSTDTYTAKLVCIEKMKKEPCKHDIELNSFYSDGNREYAKCYHCGVELVAEWKVK